MNPTNETNRDRSGPFRLIGAPQDEECGRALPASRAPRVVVLASGKGGVGRSTLAANLAVALARDEQDVILVDGHLDLPNLDLLVGVTPRGDLHDVVSGERELADTFHRVTERMELLPGRLGSDLMSNLDDVRRARLVRSVLETSAKADWVIVDTPPGLGRASLAFALSSREVLLVTTPEPASVADAYATMKALWSRRRAMRIRIVVNRAASEDEARRVARRLGSLARRSLDSHPEYLGLVYEDAAVGLAAHLMKPFVLVYPESPASVCVADLAGKLAAPPPSERSAPAEALRGGAA